MKYKNLDTDQIIKTVFDDELGVYKVRIIDGANITVNADMKELTEVTQILADNSKLLVDDVKSLLESVKMNKTAEIIIKEVKVPEIIKEIEVKTVEVEKLVIVPEVKIERVEVPVIVKETKFELIDKPVVQTVQTIETVKIPTLPSWAAFAMVCEFLAIIGLLLINLLKG